MELNNIEKAQILFPDAVKLQLRIDRPSTVADIRRLLPSSVVLLSCKISKNYAKVIYSEGAAKRMFPDVSKFLDQLSLSHGRSVYIYKDDKKNGVKLLTDFLPTSDKELVDQLELAFGDKMYKVRSFPECSMGCVFFENTNTEDVAKVLMIYRED